jgi:predicted RNA-binding Zn-ribbon protein involved in translation (DUF1610 family)
MEKKHWVNLILFVISLVVLYKCFSYFSKGDLTTNEQVLFSIFTTIASFLLSWLISHFYYEQSHKETIEDIKSANQSNLKIYATKAAEKVRNLSSQLTSLATYLNEELNSEEYETTEENLRAKEERIYSTIHIINTLKSINDGSLSDWSGIIPEEIEEIEEAEREKIENMRVLLSDYSKVKSLPDFSTYNTLEEESGEQSLHIDQLGKKIDLLLGSITGVTPKPIKISNAKEHVERKCPNCGELLTYKQKPLIKSRKSFKCNHCGNHVVSFWDPDAGFFIEKDSNPPRGKKNSIKKECEPIDEKFIQIIQNKLPVQPWPRKIGDLTAKELGVPNYKVHEAITILINRGIFKHQVGGVLYVPDPNQHVPPTKITEENSVTSI